MGDKPSMRCKAREWGVVYKPSKGETPSGEDFSMVGKVIDAASGFPLNEVNVMLSNDSLSVQYITDADGMYYLQVVPSATYSLTANLAGYEPFTTLVEAIEGEVQEVNITLTPLVQLLPPAV